jgi:hypothetical protein
VTTAATTRSPSAWYGWVSTPDQLVRAYRKSGSADEVPVLAPDAPDREHRWTQVLDWYGRDAPARSGSATHADVLACVTAEFWPVVSAFAALSGRAAIQLQPGEVPDAGQLESAATVTLVGQARSFQMAYLQRLAGSLTQPWGLLPAVDLAGLSFVLAKCLADAHTCPTSWALVDAINQCARSHRFPDSPLESGSTVELLTAADWDVLALCAHGENGHCNLVSHVLCGLVGHTEITLDGRHVSGCSEIDGIRSCKRQRGTAEVLRADEIRAKRVLLFSCTNFSVAGDLYPSNVSLIVSALEGYSASVLSCDRALPLDVADARSLVELAASGAGMAALREVENDHHERRSGSHPYFLAGDACGGAATPVRIRPDNELRLAGTLPVVLAMLDGGTEPGSVISVSPPEALVVRGARMIRVTGDDPDMPIRVTPADARLHAHRCWAANFAAGLAEADRFTIALPDYAEGRQLPALQASLQTAHRLLHGVARTAEASVRAGVWASTLDRVPALARRITLGWDKAMAQELADGLLQHNGFEQLLVDGLSLAEISHCGLCDYCGSPMCRYRYVRVDVVQCPHCGPRRSGPADAPHAEVELAGTLIPEEEAHVRVLAPADMRGAQLVMQFKDNGRNQLWWQHIGTVDADQMDFALAPPPGSAADMVTLRVAIVNDLRLSYHRLRRPCLASR